MSYTPKPYAGISCEEGWPYLPEFLDGGLEPALRERIAAHLRRCHRCGGWVKSLEGVRASLQEEGSVALPAGFLERVRAAIAADDPAIPLREGWPLEESEAERIKRLSRFSTRKAAPPEEPSCLVSDSEAAEARRLWTVPDLAPLQEGAGAVPPAPAGPPVASRLVEAAEHARLLRQRTLQFYAAGIAALLLLALGVTFLARRTPDIPRDSGATPQLPYVQALMAVNLQTYRKLEDATPQGVERFIANSPGVTWQPVVFPAFDPAIAQYVAAEVWTVGPKPVACAALKLDGYTAAIMSSPWEDEEAIPGSETAQPVKVEDYEFLRAQAGDRHLMLWHQRWPEQTVLYALLIEGPVSEESLKDMALMTRLEVEQRAREQRGTLPG